MDIKLAKTDAEIDACFSVFRELRQDLIQEEFVPTIRELEKMDTK